MDFYTNAQETEQSAISLLETGQYRHSIFLACLAIELYLKSKLYLVPHRPELEKSHDIIGLYDALCNRYQPKSDLRPNINICRKYFNEARYPYGGSANIYTKDFAMEFVNIIADVKDYIDNECMATVEDLQKMYPSM
ncbi:MAG: HEPN domain-containing protein [Defluviitaleaceae bacterium]|nr:HEPN domain-containing protein [Defluviitaleaceae bacterium]